MLFNHPDEKKGYGQLYHDFLCERYGACPQIPNTQSSRFQSNYEMARFMLHHRPASLDFLTQQRLKKTSRTFNHLEQNLWSALHDGPTLSELAALAMYGTTIGRPYMSRVRATGLVNMTELGPLHMAVISQCDLISQCPEIVTAGLQCDGSIPASVLGEPLDDPELFSMLDTLRGQSLLPHIDVPVRALFAGSRDGWIQFSREFLPGGSIANATPAQQAATIIPATNDTCESLVGYWCVEQRRAPSMCTPFFNAKTMFRRNGTSPFLKGLAPTRRAHIRQDHCRRDALGLPKLEKKRQMEFERQKAAEGQAAEARKEEKCVKQERDLDLAAPTRFLSLGAMFSFEERKSIPGKILDSNIFWHRYRGHPSVMAKLKKTTPKPTKVAGKRALLYAILEHAFDPSASGDLKSGFEYRRVPERGSGVQGIIDEPMEFFEESV